MKLNYTVKTVFEVDVFDLEDLIAEVYGVGLEIVADQEWGNDESHDVELKKQELNIHQVKYLDSFKKGKGQWVLWAVLQDMCNNGHLDEGTYLINVSW